MPNEPTTYYVLLRPLEPSVDVVPDGTVVRCTMPPGVVGVLPVYRTLVELRRENGIDAKYAELVIGGGDGE